MRIEDVISIIIIMVGVISFIQSLVKYPRIYGILFPVGISMTIIIIWELAIREKYMVIHILALIFLIETIRYIISTVNTLIDSKFKPTKIK